MRKIKVFLNFYSLPLFSSFLMGLSYIPFPPYALFFCYVPVWLFVVRQKRIGSALVGAWLCQFVTTLLGFHWLAYTLREFGLFSWPLSVLGLLLFACFANLHIPIAVGLWFWSQSWVSRGEKLSSSSLKNNGRLSVLPENLKLTSLFLLPVYFALSMEYYPMIFKWHWGYSWFYAQWPAMQTAEIWGFKFLNTLTLFFNVLVLWAYLSWLPATVRLGRWRALVICSIGLGFFILLNIQGMYLKSRWPQPDKKARVLIVQPNIENLNRLFRESKPDPIGHAFKQLIQETASFFQFMEPDFSRPDFVLWPEGAYPYRIIHNKGMASPTFVGQKAKKWQVPILLSATGESPLGVTNSLFAFDQSGQLFQAPYHKSLLLVFGEYLPGEKWFNWSRWLSYYGRSFAKGTGENKTLDFYPSSGVLSQKTGSTGYRLGFQICYESLFDFSTRDLAREKADILLNVTNDSWYGRGVQPYQHLYMTLARAIEVRRPLVRGTNTGFSAVISAKGDILKKSSLYKQDSWIQEVPYHSSHKQSLFTSWGYYINSVVLWFLFVILLLYHVVGREKL